MLPRLPAVALTLLLTPAFCQQRHPAPRPPSYDIPLPAHPFGIARTEDGNWVFVGLTDDSGAGGIAIVQRSAAGFALARVVPLPLAATGIALTHDGSLLVAAAGPEVYFLDVNGIGSAGADSVQVVGYLSDGANAGSIWVSITADDRWLFICDETSEQLTVIDLNSARTGGFTRSAVAGAILLGAAPTSLVFTPDGSLAYTTVIVVANQLGWPKVCTQEGSTDPALVNPEGAIVVIDLATAVTHPSSAVTAANQFVPAGCSPVRQVLSSDARTVYTAARNNNAAVALDATKFLTDPMNAKIAAAPVGVAPVPVALIESGALLVVGDSNRFQQPGTPQTLDILDTAKLRSGAAAIVRTVSAGSFPRALLLSPDERTLFLSNYDSNTLQVLDVANLESPASGPGR